MSKGKIPAVAGFLSVILALLLAASGGLRPNRAAASQPDTGARLAATQSVGVITRTWENMGLYGAVISAIAIDPESNAPTGTVYAGATAGHGLYRSDDGGLTWSGIYTPASVQRLAVDTTSGIVWAWGNQVITSADRGETWRTVDLPLGFEGTPSFVVSGSLTVVGSGRMIAVSYDAGAIWVTTTFPAGSQEPLRLTLDTLGSRIFAATDREIYRSSITSTSFMTSSGGLNSSHGIRHITAIGASPYVRDLVFVGTGDLGLRALYRSSDAGVSWTQVYSNGPGVGYIVFHPAYTQTIYAGGRQSTDGGLTFRDTALGNSHLAIYPTFPYTMVANIEPGIKLSTDGGVTFLPASAGIEGVVVQQVAQNPRDLGLYYVNTKSGLGRTFNGGQNWDFPLPLGSHFGGAALAPYYDVTNTARVFLGEVASTDYADTLSNLGSPSLRSLIEASGCTGQCGAFINALAANPANGDHLYAASGGAHIPPGGGESLTIGGLWESTDRGTTWISSTLSYTASYGTLPYTTPVKTVLFARGDLAYAALGDLSKAQQAGSGIAGGVISRTTGGSWQLLATATGPITSMVEALAVDPNDPQHLWAGTGQPTPDLYRTTDGGLTWQKRTPPWWGGGSFQAVAIHPQDSHIVFAASRERVYRTDDAGLTWSLISSPPVAAEAIQCILLPTLPPAPVLNLTATLTTGLQIQLSWTNPPDPSFIGAHIRRGTTSPPRTSIEGQEIISTTASSYTDTVPLTNTTYYYSVFPYDAEGRFGVGAKIAVHVPAGATALEGAQAAGQVVLLNAREVAQAAREAGTYYALAGTGSGLYRVAFGLEPSYELYLPMVQKNAP